MRINRKLLVVGAAAAVSTVVVAHRRRRTGTVTPFMTPRVDREAKVVRARFRQRALTLLLAPIVWVLTVAAWPWDDALDGAKNILEEMLEPIRRTIEAVVGWVWGYLVLIYNTIADLTGNLATFMFNATLTMARLAGRIIEMGINAVESAANYARQIVYDLMIWAAEHINQIGGWLYGLILGVLDEITKATQWVVDHVGAPLYDLILGTVRWVTDNVVPGIMDAIGWAVSPIVDGIEWLMATVIELTDFVWGTLYNTWVILEPYIETIVGLIVDPVGFFTRMVEPFKLYGKQILMDAVTEAIADYGGTFEDWFVEWAS